ncbi:MAG: serine/threonine protein kinase [Pirellulaceae bacterium]|nr:MAG: serine/threonine protein kinase [Pirellulaceae bacterium]
MARSFCILPALALFVVVLDALPGRQAESWTGWRGPNRNAWVESAPGPEAWSKPLVGVWTYDVGEGYSSPLVYNGRVYQLARKNESEIVYCIDLQTGRLLWQQRYEAPFQIGSGGERHGKGPKSTPVLASGRLFTLSIHGVLHAWNATTGQLLWRREFNEFGKAHPYWGAATSPIVHQDRLLVHVGNDEQGGALLCLNTADGTEIWRVAGDGPCYSSPVVAELDGVVQLVEWNHQAVVGVDIQTGNVLWRYALPHVGPDQNMPTPILFQYYVIIGAENRGFRALRPQREGDSWRVDVVWQNDEVAQEMSTGVIWKDYLFGFSHYDSGRLFCMDPTNGKVLWKGPPRAGENAYLLATPKYIFVLLDSGKALILDPDPNRYHVLAKHNPVRAPAWTPLVLLRDGVVIKSGTILARCYFGR